MTIAKRIVLSSAALGAGLLAAGIGVVMAFSTLQRLARGTHEEFHELCDLRDVARHVTTAQRQLIKGDVDTAQDELRGALARLESFKRFQTVAPSEFGRPHGREEEGVAARILADVAEARRRTATLDPSTIVDPGVYTALERADDDLMLLVAKTEQAIADVHTETARQFAGTLSILVASAVASCLAAVVVGVLLYRSVVTPLRSLRSGTERLTEGKLDTRLEVKGDREFVELQNGFNRMAEELESLCKDLERRVAEKSRDLALSERLASVGFLAAGVAHEINNPLAIMSGYAESLLRTARSGAAGPVVENAWIQDLETIRDEAFRCKRITQCLLDLSRLGDDHREEVAVARVVEACMRLIAAWPASRNVKFDIQSSLRSGGVVRASEPELRQVVLNLLANAVEATPPVGGTVSVSTERNNGWIEIRVRDDGCGMTRDTLAHAFEPFYSAGKRGSGLGLGLAISHAIARRHGGVLEATSPGPGLGSTLVLRLPAKTEPMP